MKVMITDGTEQLTNLLANDTFRDHSLWDRCLCFAVSLEFELSVQFPCILVLRYEIPLFEIGIWCIVEGYFRFCIFGHQYMLAGVYLIGHNLDYLLFTTNGNIFLEWNQWAFGNGNWSFIICDNWRRICLLKHQWFAFALQQNNNKQQQQLL